MNQSDESLKAETNTQTQAGTENPEVVPQAAQPNQVSASALEAVQKKAEENWDLYMRARADMENVRRRAQIDVENAHKYSVEKFARELLAVVDSLEHGLVAAQSTSEQDAIRQGIALTFKMLLDTLDKFGVKRIEPEVGDGFQPLLHEAISTQVKNDIESNKILIVAQKGFVLQDRVLRPARVIVSRNESVTKVDEKA